MKQAYDLEDYSALAYEFAIRNPEVIKLLKSPLDEKVAKELLTYGIDTLIDNTDSEGNHYETYSLEGLYLDYPHLGDNLKGIHRSRNGTMYTFEEYRELFPDAIEGEWKGDKRIVHPETYSKYFRKGSDIDALNRIERIFKKKAGHLKRIMDGSIFKYYDDHILNNDNFDGRVSKKKENDVNTIKTFIKKQFYLLLIPNKISMFKPSSKKLYRYK